MLNSLSEKLVSYVSPSSDGGREDIENVEEPVQSSVDSDNGGKHKRCEQPIDVDSYEPCVKRRRLDGGFVQKVTNSVAKMAEWLVHGTNYLLGRLDDTQLNLKEIEEQAEEAEENGQHLDEIPEELDDDDDTAAADNDYFEFSGIPNTDQTSSTTPGEQENEVNIDESVSVKKPDSQLKAAPLPRFLPRRFPISCNRKYHRPPIHDESGFGSQETKPINGNSSAIHILYSSKSKNVTFPLYNGDATKYRMSPGVRVNCSNARNVGLSSNKLYSIPSHSKVRNDVCNVVQRPHMHTAAQCVRLEEKERYRRLIQQFSRGDYVNQNAVKSEEKDTSSVTSKTSSHRETCSPLGDLLSDPLQVAESGDLDIPIPSAAVSEDEPDQTSLSEMSTPKQKISFSDTESPEESQSSDAEKSTESTSSKSSPRPSVRLKNNPYLAEDWVTQLVKKYSASTREQKRKIEEEQLKIKIFAEKRKSQEEQLNEEIQLRLQLSEKEQPVFEIRVESDKPPSLPENKKSLFPEITAAMRSEIDSALKPLPSEEVLVEGFRIQIKRQDMTTLSGLTWLNDEVINFYLSLLMERSSQGRGPKVHSFNTFFYPKLLGSGYDGVRRWTRKVDIFSVKYLLIPVHLGMHWCMAVVNFVDKTICYYDSMGGKNHQCLETIKKYLCDESLDKRKTPFDLAGWTTKIARDVPHQMNGSDCGMFACKYADYITREIPISFTQADMPQFRRLMVYEILKKKLLT